MPARSEPAPASVEEAQPLTRIVVRPLGTPLPIGLLAFAMGSFVSAGYTLGWFPVREQQDLALVLLAFAFPLELLPVPFALLARDAVAATTLAIFSAQWLVTGLVLITSPLVGGQSELLGGFALMLAAIILVPAIAAAPARPLLALGLLVAAAQSVVSGIGTLADSRALGDAGSLIGLVLAGGAVYAALALLLEDTFKRTVLPMTRRRSARQAIEDPLPAQVDDLPSTAGVRKSL